MRKILLLLAFVGLSLPFALAQTTPFSKVESQAPILFPHPSKMEVGEGDYTPTQRFKIQTNASYAEEIALKMETVAKKSVTETSKGRTLLKVELLTPETPLSQTLTSAPSNAQDESYTLEILERNITLKAFSEAGLYHGYEAFRQLLRWGKGKIQTLSIENSPRYAWRGFMLDESRHFFGKEKVKQIMDLMAMLHMNVFHWHLTDEPGWRVEIKRYPKLTQEGAIGNWHDPHAKLTFYTQDDIRELVAYAKERHIMVIPEFDMPGHATAVCRSYPEISSGGEGKWKDFVFHPSREATFEFISNVFDELFELFPAPYIHIGGDEVHFGNQTWYTDPEILAFIKVHNLGDAVGLEHYFIRRIADMVAQKGKTIIGWDEVVDSGVDPSKAVVVWWRHNRPQQLQKALDRGFRVILAPRRPLYADFVQHESHQIGRRWTGFCPVEDVYNFPTPLMEMLQGHEQQIWGLQMNLWTERVVNFRRLDFMTFPRLVAAAEAGWNIPQNKSCEGFMQRLPRFLELLDEMGIYYFNPFDPQSTPEPDSPDKDDPLKNG